MLILKVLDHLNDFERNNLLKTHSIHIKSMGEQERQKHTLENIIKVERNFNEKCFNVHFKHGEFYKYTLNNEWY